MTVARIGPYAGNAGSPPPAWTATVDYFFNTASARSFPKTVLDTTPPVISGVSVTPAQTSATVAWTTDEVRDEPGRFGSDGVVWGDGVGSVVGDGAFVGGVGADVRDDVSLQGDVGGCVVELGVDG